MNDMVQMQTMLDAYKAARDMRLEEQRKVDALKKQENEMQYNLVTFLQDHPEINGVIGSTHKGMLKDSQVPIINNLEAFQEFVANDNWDCAYSLRPSGPAVRDRIEAGVEVPGVELITETKLSVTKI